MKKVCIVVDKEGSAIDILSRPIKKYNPQLDIVVLPVHPKRPDKRQLDKFEFFGKQADVIHFQYWKTAEMLKTRYDWIDKKPLVLSHHNPYDVDKQNWQEGYDVVLVNNSTIGLKLPYAHLVPNCIDLSFWKFQKDYPEDNRNVNMVAGRIESSKGILEVAKACRELGYKFNLVGRISDGEYFNKIKAEGVKFYKDVTVEEVRDAYYDSAIHVCNSKDNFESGTMPMLEAMACGVPVLTRRIGHVPDIFDKDNMVVRSGDKEDIKDLKKELKDLMEDYEKRKKMRDKGWHTARRRDIRFTARDHSRIYNQAAYPGISMVSVVVPTFNRIKELGQIVFSLINQSYKNIELVIADDGSTDNIKGFVSDLREMDEIWFPIKYTNTGDTDKYHLAKARNMGITEAVGDYILFLDDRFKIDKNAINSFLKHAKPKTWQFGDKGAQKKTFVENFSFVDRQEVIDAGMFNERIEQYGGMSQEIRERINRQGFTTEYNGKAKSEIISNTKSRYHKRDEIVESKYILYKLNL
jgi:glycosyltransferase involved in cell wall biosynthesis